MGGKSDQLQGVKGKPGKALQGLGTQGGSRGGGIWKSKALNLEVKGLALDTEFTDQVITDMLQFLRAHFFPPPK